MLLILKLFGRCFTVDYIHQYFPPLEDDNNKITIPLTIHLNNIYSFVNLSGHP